MSSRQQLNELIGLQTIHRLIRAFNIHLRALAVVEPELVALTWSTKGLIKAFTDCILLKTGFIVMWFNY